MQQTLEQALDCAESVIESAQQRPPKRKYSPSGEKSLHQKLYDIYVEECEKEPGVTEELRGNVNLLEKLVAKESLPCLVVNLYPGKEGYSLMLKENNESCSETIRMAYEEGELLEYLDAEELPPVLVDLLEKCEMNIFHRGCVITEVRDYRQCSNMEPPGYQSRHILLRPTMQTLVTDVQSIAGDDQNWTQEDKLLLESQLILATAEPLCLDPSVTVACTENRLLYNKQKMNTHPMKQNFKRYSMPSLNREQELSHLPAPEQRVSTSCKHGQESRTDEHCVLTFPTAGKSIDIWKQRPCDLDIPSEVGVEKYAKRNMSVESEDSEPTVWPTQEIEDDYVFGSEIGHQYQKKKLPFMQSLNDPLFSGRVSSSKKVRYEKQMSPSHCSMEDQSFMSGLKTDAEMIVSQSEEFVQEKADSPVNLSYSSSESPSPSQLSPEKETEQPERMSVQSLVLRKGVKQIPLSAKHPSSSENSSPGNNFIPQQASNFLKSPSPTPASKSPTLPQKFSVEMDQLGMVPVDSLSAVSSSQSAPALSTAMSSQRTPAQSPVSSSESSLGLSTIGSSLRTPGLPDVSSSQSIPDLSTVSSSQRIPTLPSVSSSQRIPTLSNVSSSQRIPTLSAVSSSQRIPTLSSVSSSRRTSCHSTVSSSQRIPTLSVVSSSWRTTGQSTVSSSQRTTGLSTVSSSQRTTGQSIVSSSQRTTGQSTVSSSQRTTGQSTVSSSQRTTGQSTVSSSQRTTGQSTVSSSQRTTDQYTVSSSRRTTGQSTVSSSWRTTGQSTVSSSQRIPTLSTVSSSQRIPTLSTVSSSRRTTGQSTVSSSQRIPTLSAVSSSQRIPTLSTVGSSRRTTGLSTVSSSQRIPTLSTNGSSRRKTGLSSVSSSQRIPTLSSVSSSQRIPTLSTVSSSQRIPTLSTVSLSQRIPTLSTVDSSHRIPTLSTVDSSQRIPTLSTVSSSQRIPTLSTVSSAPRIPVLSTVSSPQRTPSLLTVISSQSTPGLSTVSSPQRIPALSTVSSSQRTPALSTVSSLKGIPASSTVNPSQRLPVTQVMANSSGLNIINVVGPVLGAQALVSGSNTVQGSTPRAVAPAESKPSNQPSQGQTPNVLPVALQEPSQVGVQLFLENNSSLGSLTLLQVPQGSLILNTQQQPQKLQQPIQMQQPQQSQQQWLYQLIPQLQQSSTSCPQQPVSQGSSAQGSTSQAASLSAQQAVVINLTGVGTFTQPQAAVLSQLSSAQSRPEQSQTQQIFQLPSTLQQHQSHLQHQQQSPLQLQQQPKSQSYSQVQCQQQTQLQLQSQGHPKLQHQQQSWLQAQEQPQPRLRSQSRPRSRPRSRSRPQPRLQPRPQPQLQPRPQPRVQPRPQPRLQPRPQPRLQPRPQPQLQLQPQPWPQLQSQQIQWGILQHPLAMATVATQSAQPHPAIEETAKPVKR